MYTAQYQGNKVIVKSIRYLEGLEETDYRFDRFLNFIDEKVPVAPYIAPSVAHSDDLSLLVTMSKFASGMPPTELPPDAPYTWIYDE